MRTTLKLSFFLLLFTLMFYSNTGILAEDVQQGSLEVTIESGKIRGTTESKSPAVIVFRGIPFAEPPVGELRWKPPQKVKSWEGIKDCTKFAPSCPQLESGILAARTKQESEDCLYLNVWTTGSSEKPRPVMFWIHGGGFTIGAGSFDSYNGRHFAENGIVLVTINYRLGPFGFLAHPALSAESQHKSSGHYGLLDQIAALQWVKDNISQWDVSQ